MSAVAVANPVNHAAVANHGSLPFSVMLHGLSGSGKSACEVQLGVSDSAHSIDTRFLTSPQIYSSNYQHPNKPRFARRAIMDNPNSVWKYGGRGSVNAKWSVLAAKSKAEVFVVDSTDRTRLAPAADFKPLPLEYVIGYDNRSKEEQAEMFALLESQMTAKSMLQNLRSEIGEYRRKPILVLATKQDMNGAMPVEEICEALNLKSLTNIDWKIIGVDATSGEGFDDAIEWLKRVVATPTDFKSNRAVSDDDSWFSNNYQWISYSLRNSERQYQSERITRGDVLRAPALYLANGTIFKADPKLAKEFVLTPLTPDTLDSMAAFYEKQVKLLKQYTEGKQAEKFEALLPQPVHIQWQLQQEFFENLKQQEAEEIVMDLIDDSESDNDAEEVGSNASTVTGTPDASSESDADSIMEDIPEVQSPLMINKKAFFEEKKFPGFEAQARRVGVTAN